MAGLQGAGTPASTVFVGNLAYDLSEQDVIDYFSKIGPVKAIRIVTERETGKPRGFGFVEFYDIPTAESCIRNLNGADLNGRTLRIVFAEGGPADFRPRDDFPRPDPEMIRSRRAASRTKLVGADLAYHSSQGMSVLLGQDPNPNAPADQLTKMLMRKTRSELYEYLAQMQSLLHQNPQQARRMLVDNPQLARALFHMEIILGMVNNPLGDIAPKGIAPPGIAPPPRQYEGMDQPPPHYGAPPPGQYLPPGSGPGAAAVGPGGPPPAAMAPMDPRRQQQQPMVSAVPPMQNAPMSAGPRPMVSVAAGGPLPGSMPTIAVPGMSEEQSKALVQQVISLTPQQIELLPPEQKAQVLAIQQQLRAQGR